MTHEDLARRIYAAKHDLIRVGGTRFEGWSVAVHPCDLASIKRTFEQRFGTAMDGVLTIFGMALLPDDRLRRGEVRLRAEVAA